MELFSSYNFQVGYFCHQKKCHPKMSKTFSVEKHLFLRMSALHRTHSAPDPGKKQILLSSSFTQENKNQCPNHQKKLPRKVSFIIYVVGVVSIVLNEMVIQINHSLTWLHSKPLKNSHNMNTSIPGQHHPTQEKV